MSRDQLITSSDSSQPTPPQREVTAGKSTVSSRLPVLRRADGASRDDNGVAAGADVAVDRAAGSAGQTLPDDLRSRFEGSVGADLSGVRVHTGSESAEASKAVGARAYTVGQDIHFGAGQYDPGSPFGVHLLAHEVAHTVQQQGAEPSRQNKLEVSAPLDSAELEADVAADAMLAGQPVAVGRGLSSRAARTPAEEMKKEADEEQAAVIKEGPPLIMGMSSVATQDQARGQINKVQEGQSNLRQREAHFLEKVASSGVKGKPEQERLLGACQGFIAANVGVIGTLQHIVDLGSGNARLDEGGKHRPGHDMRTSMFAGLYPATLQDFARLQGTVNAFLQANPGVSDSGGADSGNAMGTAVANGGTGKDVGAVHKDVLDTQGKDNELNEKLNQLRAGLGSLEGASYSAKIDAQLGKCAGAVSGLKNVQLEVKIGTTRPDSKDQAAAQGEMDKVKSDLADANAALDKAAEVAKMAAAALGMPAVGALGGGSVLTGAMSKITEHGGYQAAATAYGVAGDAGKMADVDVGGSIQGAIAKMMTDYDARMLKAKGRLNDANSKQNVLVGTLDDNKVAVAKGHVGTEFDALKTLLEEMAKKKKQIRDLSHDVTQIQKKNGAKGGPDIAGISQSLSEVTIFCEQAKATVLQGEEEQKIAKEMIASREEVAGKMGASGKDNGMHADTGGAIQTGKAQKDQAFYDCEPAAPYLLKQSPIEFSIWTDKKAVQGADPADPASQSQALKEGSQGYVETAAMEVSARLSEIKECLVTAEGFKGPLKKAIGGY